MILATQPPVSYQNTPFQSAILIVDDNPANLSVLFDCLDQAGFEVLVAQDGESALQKATYRVPNLVLLDVMMPGIDGFETCRRLKANALTQDIPVIFMTALSDTSDKVKGLSVGAVDYVTKPFQQEEVLARIAVHLRIQHLTQTLAQQNEQLQQEVRDREAAQQALYVANQALEQTVAERTRELQDTIAQLRDTLQTLKNTQMQMIQAEKMAGLGQLVAGIAHEINNPVNFIHGNLAPAKEYLDRLVELITLYQRHYPQPSPEIIAWAEENDLEFVAEDLPRLLRSMQVGAERIRAIVVALRNFSRMDEAEQKAVDIHDGIDSTLMILQNRIKGRGDRPKVEIVKDYGLLPPVECCPGPLNQVFMNLLSNAIDAVEEAYPSLQTQPRITIRTMTSADTVHITITDNGRGVPPHLQVRIFDPFFTTKPIGKGTGMGLSISHQIVTENHCGTLRCESVEGEGTTFLLTLPIRRGGTFAVQP
ncbi:response regulator [Leptolyngbya sp. PCC 6406]|uniref:hybrid sensor histidine kinase/response regulator n=1 Tax=Leptolyngbya sp. PCC 6406 TaxID=1173264 RepID=UPI0002AD0048|nr:response regulator [Leptolyngbya sp. PCC 6406]